MTAATERHPSMVYFYGTGDGTMVKIGWSRAGRPLAKRRAEIDRDAFRGSAGLRLLAAVRGGFTEERSVQDLFREFQVLDVQGDETFYAVDEVVEYINWLRQQWFTWLAEDQGPDDREALEQWAPRLEDSSRRLKRQQLDESALLPRYAAERGPLFGTPWQSLVSPATPFNDYYTPAWLVNLAREAMGDIDLDAASHYTANLVHKVPLYFHVNRSAFLNKWAGRVWLNPPYGENHLWFPHIVNYWDSGDITQLCMLSPVWAFTTQIAREVIDRSSAMVLLSPTPKFWGHKVARNGKPAEDCGPDEEPSLGSNHPHAVIYLGDRVAEFKAAFGRPEVGIPMTLDAAS